MSQNRAAPPPPERYHKLIYIPLLNLITNATSVTRIVAFVTFIMIVRNYIVTRW